MVKVNLAMTKGLSWIQSGRLPGCLLLVGPASAHLEQKALKLVQSVLCEKSFPACGECPTCLRVDKKTSESLIYLAPENNVIRIDVIREVLQQLSMNVWGKARFVVIHSAHLMNPQASNALLKSLEEPPAKTHFFLTSSSQHNLLPTLRSRSQVLRFGNELEATAELDGDDFRHQCLTWLNEVLLLPSSEEARLRARDQFLQRADGLRLVRECLLLIREAWWSKDQLGPSLFSLKDNQKLKTISGFDDVTYSELGRSLLDLEKDILAQCDVGLCLENFVYQTRQKLGIVL